jgi:uncharacterized membrane protein
MMTTVDHTVVRRSSRWRAWRVPIGLVTLSLVPALAGSVRLAELASGATVTNDNRRFFDSPAPVVIHIVSVVIFSLAGAFQFAPSLRRSGKRWHRRSGYVIAPAGVAAALSGLWMTRFYDLPASDNAALGVVRYVVGVAMLGALVLGWIALQARRFRRHGAWMARAYALGLGAGTQVLTTVAWLIVSGKPTPSERAWLMTAGWAINVAAVEFVLRRRRPGKR